MLSGREVLTSSGLIVCMLIKVWKCFWREYQKISKTECNFDFNLAGHNAVIVGGRMFNIDVH